MNININNIIVTHEITEAINMNRKFIDIVYIASNFKTLQSLTPSYMWIKRTNVWSFKTHLITFRLKE